MANAGEITVTVNLVVTLDGEPITHTLEVPATYHFGENEDAAGLTVNLQLDGARLARALAPLMMREMGRAIRNAAGPGPFR